MSGDIPPDLASLLEGLQAPPRAARLEVGILALGLLYEYARRDANRRPTRPPGVAAIWGVPVVLDTKLAAGAWRMVDADGEEIAAGDLCPVPRRAESGETGAMDEDPQPTTPEPTGQPGVPTFSGSAPWGAFAISGEWSDPEENDA